MSGPGALPGTPPVVDPKSKAACEYMDSLTDLTTDFKTKVGCTATAAGPTPLPPALPVVDPAAAAAATRKAEVEGFLAKIKTDNNATRKTELDPLKVEQDAPPGYAIFIRGGTTEVAVGDKDNEVAVKDNIAAMLKGAALTGGGRRGKRSARRSKSRKGGRKSRKGGRRSRGCKGRKSRGRTIKCGAKMSKELKAWIKRQEKATGVKPISKKTIDAAKTTSQATGSEQRSESGKHVAAKQRNL